MKNETQSMFCEGGRISESHLQCRVMGMAGFCTCNGESDGIGIGLLLSFARPWRDHDGAAIARHTRAVVVAGDVLV